MNLAVINTKTNDIKIVDGEKKILGMAQFTRMLVSEEIESFRSNPKKFLAEVEWTDPADQAA